MSPYRATAYGRANGKCISLPADSEAESVAIYSIYLDWYYAQMNKCIDNTQYEFPRHPHPPNRHITVARGTGFFSISDSYSI